MTWQDSIRNADCTLCPLHEGAEYVCLMGSGSKQAKIMIVGEAPGAREDATHQAFVGAAGKLLTELLEEVGISREECYITNAVKCRPPGNATPSRSEAKICSNAYLAEEVSRLSPSYILSLGNTGLQVTTGRSGITKYRGQVFSLGESRVLPTFHPAAGLRSPKYLPHIRADFAAFARLYRGEVDRDGPGSTRVKIVRTPSQLNWLIKKLEGAPVVAFDLETDGLDEWRDGVQIVTAGFSWEPGTAAVVPLNHPDFTWKDPRAITRRLKRVLEAHPKLVAHNGKFDARWFAASGIYVKVSFDTMLAAHVLDENRSKSLESLATTDIAWPSWKIGFGSKSPRETPLKKLCIYNGRDCDATLQLRNLYAKQLKDEPRLARLFMKLMMPANHALTKIERGGIYIHGDKFAAADQTVASNISKLQRYMDRSSDGINYNSPQQVARWLFEGLQLPMGEMTKSGAPSTKEGVLLWLAKENKQVAALLKYRKWQKYSGYLNNWSERTDGKGRIHPSFLLHGTVTGRLSSRSPNLQQVPRDPFMRSIFGSPPGWLLVEADYSQIELRLIAMLANEPTMKRILATGGDLHTTTASGILKKVPSEISKDERVIWGKHPNFGLCFGMSAGDPEGGPGGYVTYCLDNGIEMNYEDAVITYRRFHETYSRLKPWYDRQKRLAARYGYVTNKIGRIRHLTDMKSSDRKVKAEAERQAINSPVQSLASDICLSSLVVLSNELDERVARIVGSIHDSILLQVQATHIGLMAPHIRAVMEDMSHVRRMFGAEIDVPIRVDVSVGDSWGEGDEVPR